ncbi:MAG: hypothetical protein WHS77_11030 [Brevinematales bacterium]
MSKKYAGYGSSLARRGIEVNNVESISLVDKESKKKDEMKLSLSLIMTEEQSRYFDETYKLWQWNEEMEREYIRFKEMEYVDKVKSETYTKFCVSL